MDNSLSIDMISIYRKRAKRYDWTTLLLYLGHEPEPVSVIGDALRLRMARI